MEKDRQELPEASEKAPLSEQAVMSDKGVSLYGEPDIAPSLYWCSTHGNMLAQDIVWDRNDEPHCPKCSTLLTLAESSDSR